MRTTIQWTRIVSFICLTAALICVAGPSRAEESAPVTFQFVDVEIPVVVQFISEVTGKNFLFDERVRGKVTILAPEPIAANQAFDLFTSILDLKGYAVVPAGPLGYKIIPSSDAKEAETRVLAGEGGGAVNEGYVARVFQLRYISSKDAFVFLQPLVAKNGHISSFGAGNLLLVVDNSPNLDKVARLIDLIDVPSAPPPVEKVLLQHGDAEEVAAMVNKALAGGPAPRVRGSKNAPAPPEEETVNILADTRLNAVILVGGTDDTVAAAKNLIRLLDQPVEQTRAGITVIDLQYADATELADVLNKLFTAQKTSTVRAASARRAPQSSVPAAPSSEFEGPVRITPDAASNSLVVMAAPSDMRDIQNVVRSLDRRRRQVLVEALFLEVSVDDLQDLGTQWRVVAEDDNEPVLVGGFGSIDTTTFSSIIQGLSGISIGGLGDFFDFTVTGPDGNQVSLTAPGYAALFSMQQFNDVIDVLSAPHILTSDNQEAEIMVGENVPFISKRETAATGSTSDSFFNVIERTDVGIKLHIKPQVTEGDTLRLQIYQEISSLQGNQSDEILTAIGPTTTKRSTETSITVRDGSTVVIGGLMQERGELVETKVPLLGDIPLLGWLFKFQSDTRRKNNLLVFITPHVVRDDEFLGSLSRDKERMFRSETGRFVPGQAVVRFKEGVSRERVDEILASLGATTVVLREDGMVIALPEDLDVRDAMKRLERYAEVTGAAPNFTVFGSRTRSPQDFR